jgi:iron complex transport system substrate-binding protein
MTTLAVLTFAACSSPSASDTASGSPAASGPWSFVDDRPIEVSLDTVPQRIVAYETGAAGLMGYGNDSVVGIFGSAPMDQNPFLSGLDLTGIQDVGSVYGEVNFEAIAALDPDLIVTTAYIDERTGEDASNIQLGGIVGKQDRELLESIAPIVGIDELLPASAFIERWGDLASSLGADLTDPEVGAGKERFDAAVSAFRAALADNPGLTVMAVYAGSDALYVAQPVPREFQDLPEWRDWGMNIVDPKSDDQYFELLSWEEADRYPADVILIDSRPGSGTAEDAASYSPTWSALPAVKADQLYEWKPYVSTSIWDTYATEIENLTEVIKNAQDVA